ncbi:MAG TPA: alpha/beta hydrolase [Ktedonobacteraceae bacterium]|nr:alpha/beta hydrolase [Ktedonobacteraceae bacterium]
MSSRPLSRAGAGRKKRRSPWLFAVPFLVAGALASGYAAISLLIAKKLAYAPHVLPHSTPASLGLEYRDVIFPSREDHLQIHGWFIPGVLPGGHLTTRRAIIMVHGVRTNRADKDAGLLELSAHLARQGFAVLAFDMRGSGASARAPLTLGYFEERDVLGAVDFLQAGPLPYPELGRPRVVGGWGVSMGGATLLLAAAREPAIRAIVSDSAYSNIIPILEREIPLNSRLPRLFTPGALLAGRILYGASYYAIRPVDVIASLAPRPVLFIHGAEDLYISPSHMHELAACTATGACIQTWLVPGAEHAQSFNTLLDGYVARVAAFYNEALGTDSEDSA